MSSLEMVFFLKFIWIPFVGVMWWELRNLRKQINEAEKEIADFRVRVAEQYVKHKDLNEVRRAIDELRADIKDIIREAIKGGNNGC